MYLRSSTGTVWGPVSTSSDTSIQLSLTFSFSRSFLITHPDSYLLANTHLLARTLPLPSPHPHLSLSLSLSLSLFVCLSLAVLLSPPPLSPFRERNQ